MRKLRFKEVVVCQNGATARVKHMSVQSLSSVQFSRSVVSDSLRPYESQHSRPPCPSPTPRVHSDSRPSSQWCHPAISSSVVPFSSCPQSLPASESFPMSQLFTWGVQSTGVSALASFLPKKSQGWSPSEWTGWICLQSKGLSGVFSNTTVQKHQFFGAQPSSQSNSRICTWPLEKPWPWLDFRLLKCSRKLRIVIFSIHSSPEPSVIFGTACDFSIIFLQKALALWLSLHNCLNIEYSASLHVRPILQEPEPWQC